jgi:hypothetical protein
VRRTKWQAATAKIISMAGQGKIDEGGSHLGKPLQDKRLWINRCMPKLLLQRE